ncbi:MAG: NAD(P)-dependent alcohol dehydrogenase [Spirochaetales bacterium]|nr:MAG: NAD(P)-dependent alcohol dehydrogenase [Spirochaetales bacterium]
MKAAFLDKPGSLIIKDVDIPVFADDEVLIRIRATGICGSDLHYFREGRVGTNVIRTPHILGHESTGEIIETGKAVKNLKKGDRVAVEPGVPCLRCDHCLRGRYNLCNEVKFLGAPPNHGTLREYIAHKSLFVHKLPDNLSFAEGAFFEPLAVGYNAIVKSGIKPGESVVITGAGPIGIVCLMLAKLAGAARITILDVDRYRLKIAESMGANETLLPEEAKAPSPVHDCVIEATGTEEGLTLCVEYLKKGGRMVLVGMSNSPVSLNTIALLRKEAAIYTVYRYANYYQPVLELFRAGISMSNRSCRTGFRLRK